MFTSTIIVELIVGTICLAAGIMLLLNGRKSKLVDATIEGPGERPGAYVIIFERDGKKFRGNYKSRKNLEAGTVVKINTNEKQIIPNNWKIGCGLCFALAVFDYLFAFMGIVS